MSPIELKRIMSIFGGCFNEIMFDVVWLLRRLFFLNNIKRHTTVHGVLFQGHPFVGMMKKWNVGGVGFRAMILA